MQCLKVLRKIFLSSNLSEKEIEALYEAKIVKRLIPYINSYNKAMTCLDSYSRNFQTFILTVCIRWYTMIRVYTNVYKEEELK